MSSPRRDSHKDRRGSIFDLIRSGFLRKDLNCLQKPSNSFSECCVIDHFFCVGMIFGPIYQGRGTRIEDINFLVLFKSADEGAGALFFNIWCPHGGQTNVHCVQVLIISVAYGDVVHCLFNV